MLRAAAAQATRSPRYFGKMRPSLTAPTWCPARPMRCRPLATDGGASICTTRSIAPMSMPSSSEDVATRPRSRPSFSASSMSTRCGRASDPWWARTRGSPASSFSAAARRSATRRLLTKISVEVCDCTSASSRGWIAVQIDGRVGPCEAGPLGMSIGSASRAMSSTGTSIFSRSALRRPASTMVIGRAGVAAVSAPVNSWAISLAASAGRAVGFALRPPSGALAARPPR